MIAQIWRKLVLSVRLLAACRFSLLSALGGLALLWGVVQAQNLFADLAFSNGFFQFLHWLWFLLAVFLFWAFPVHYGARRVLDEPHWLIPAQLRRDLTPDALDALQNKLREELACAIKWVPRMLGLVPFAAVAIGLHECAASMDQARALEQSQQAHSQILWLQAGNALAAAGFAAFVIWRQPLLGWLADHAELRNFGGREQVKRHLSRFAQFSLVFTALFFVAAYLRPHELAALTDRALLIPFLFGSLVLVLSLLARRGHESGWPVLVPIFAFSLLLTASNKHLNDLRLLPQRPADQLAARQIDLSAAVAKWREANGCAQDGSKCPSALILAAEGGASRAAFMTATVAGEIIDRTGAGGAPGRRIFAISGVSGGAYGAAAIRAALADAADADGKPPCRNADPGWFAAHDAATPGFRESWRSCLQILVSGDYLSSGFIGLGFRDNFAPAKGPFGEGSAIVDRAALLEQSWERHYDETTGGAGFFGGAVCGAGPGKGLCRPFGYAGASQGWLPLLMLNGTSVSTGRRIVAADLVSTRKSPDGGSRQSLYAQAYDLFELMSRPCPEKLPEDAVACPQAAQGGADQPQLRDATDIRLSTAALISARFPVISPAGVIRNDAVPGYGDRVVDGGYFENSGLTTALDLAQALNSQGVTPAIVWVQNDPNIDRARRLTPPRAAATPKLGPLDDGLFTEAAGMLAAPIDALISTREGHGEEAADAAAQALAHMNSRGRAPLFHHPDESAPRDRRRSTRRRPVPKAMRSAVRPQAVDERGVDELVAVGRGASRTRRPVLRPRQSDDPRRHGRTAETLKRLSARTAASA